MTDSSDVTRLGEVIADYGQPAAANAYRQYFSRDHAAIQGWLLTPILTALGLIVDVQTRAGFKGGFAEIGVHHGRFYCALATARESGWHGVAIDVFEDQHLNPDGSGKGNLGQFKGNMQRLGLDPANHTIIQSDSKLVAAERIRSAVGGKGVLVFSVDGAHTVDYTVADLELAARALHPCGVIIVDDLFNGRWPGVIEGVLNWLRSDPDFPYEMVAYGNNKGFLAHRDVAPLYRSLLAGLPGLPASRSDAVVFAGRDSIFCKFAEPTEIFKGEIGLATVDETDRTLTFVKGGNGVRTLRSGWSKPEAHGTWSCALRASVGIPFGNERPLRNCRIGLEPFLPNGKSQNLKVFLSGREVASVGLKSGYQDIDVSLHASDLPGAGTIEIAFETAELFSPYKLGLSQDSRDLGIRLKSITFTA